VRRALALALLVAIAGCGGGGEDGGGAKAPNGGAEAGGPARPGDLFTLREVASGFDQPLGLVQEPGAETLWVVEQPGRVVSLDGRRTLVDVRDRVVSGGEQGLLGLAFDPGYARNRRFYLHYTNREGDTRVDEHTGSTRRELLAVDQPFPNHNGGQLSFGPDGELYLGLGDGGSANDPQDNGQDLDARLGKLLRLDGGDWSPVAYGLRNPWRFSWDRATGSLWIADVGQDEREEIDVVPELGDPPPNFGWPAFEGNHDPDGREPSGPGRLVFPVAEYGHDEGCSVTGGYVYRGKAVPGLRGRYLYGDVCSGRLWTLRAGRASASDVRREDDELEQVSSFGEDRAGELYAVSLTGSVFRVEASD
jgi:glucose/arabinose dehydrogenase